MKLSNLLKTSLFGVIGSISVSAFAQMRITPPNLDQQVRRIQAAEVELYIAPESFEFSDFDLDLDEKTDVSIAFAYDGIGQAYYLVRESFNGTNLYSAYQTKPSYQSSGQSFGEVGLFDLDARKEDGRFSVDDQVFLVSDRKTHMLYYPAARHPEFRKNLKAFLSYLQMQKLLKKHDW